jgi:hypothetical protein
MSTLCWSLYLPGSEVAFRAEVVHGGYSIAVSRDGRELVNEQACDTSSLLRRSSELREQFERLGYSALPHDEDAALAAGPCWGPGTPLPASAISHPDPVQLSWDGWQAALRTPPTQ